MLKKLFGKLLGKSNKSVVQSEQNQNDASTWVDINAPMIYIFQVSKEGMVKFVFKCEDGKENEFGIFLNYLTSGQMNEEIIMALSQIFPKESFDKMSDTLNSTIYNDEDMEDDELPIIMPSQVFQGINKT